MGDLSQCLPCMPLALNPVHTHDIEKEDGHERGLIHWEGLHRQGVGTQEDPIPFTAFTLLAIPPLCLFVLALFPFSFCHL